MDGQKQDKPENNYVVCCFCGQQVHIEYAVQIVIYPNQDDESQNLYSHKDCLNRVLHKTIPRHPDLLPNN